MSDLHDPIEAVRHLDPIDGEDLASRWSDSALSAAVLEQVTERADAPAGPQTSDPESPSGLFARTSVRLGVAASVVAAATAAILLWPSSLPPALAGWTTQPQPVSDEVRRELVDHCQTDPDQLQDEPGRPEVVTEVIVDLGKPDLIDQRGGAAVARWLFLNGDEQIGVECLVGDNDNDGEWDFGGRSVAVGTPAVGPESYSSHINESFGHRVKAFSGTTVPAATRVVALRSDGTTVEASMSDEGHFIAWWPETGRGTDVDKIVTYKGDEVLDEWDAEDHLPDEFR